MFLVKAYVTYVRPILEYNTPVWSPYLKKDIAKVERVQRYFTKRLHGLKDVTYVDRLQALNLESLEERRLKYDLVAAFNIIKGHTDFKTDHRTRGHSLQIKVKYSRTETQKNFFSNRVVAIWNSLPKEVLNVEQSDKFNHLIPTELVRSHCELYKNNK